jgi:hypothetical protein
VAGAKSGERGDVTMWGIRATRIGFLLAGMIATIAATGCCSDCCKKLWGHDKDAPTGQGNAVDKRDDEADQVLKTWRPTTGFQSQTPQMTGSVERIQGKIY